MPKKITSLNRAKIYHPGRIHPLFSTNVITYNKTMPDGNVENSSELNAIDAREWVNDNKL